jgi:phosphotransferase system  glucose/maltose/N-acetylglucosamine-specific IIC component
MDPWFDKLFGIILAMLVAAGFLLANLFGWSLESTWLKNLLKAVTWNQSDSSGVVVEYLGIVVLCSQFPR